MFGKPHRPELELLYGSADGHVYFIQGGLRSRKEQKKDPQPGFLPYGIVIEAIDCEASDSHNYSLRKQACTPYPYERILEASSAPVKEQADHLGGFILGIRE